MRPAFVSLLSGLLLAATSLAPAPLAAQAPGDSVRLYLVPEELVVGGFVARTADAWQLSVRDRDPRLIPAASVRRAERRVVRTRRELRSKSIFRGMLIGAAAGLVLYSTEIGSQSSDPGLGGLLIIPLTAAGAIYGGGIGWVVGSMLPEVKWQAVR